MTLVYLSPVPWASFAQRPHKFVTWFHATTKRDVLWVDPYPTRLPVFADFSQMMTKQTTTIVENTPKWLTIVRPRALPIEPLWGIGTVNGLLWRDVLRVVSVWLANKESILAIGKPSALAVQILKRHKTTVSLYDAMDDFPAFYEGLSKASLKNCEEKILSLVSQVLVSSTRLAERFTGRCAKLTLVLNACAAHTLPALKPKNKENKLILGYVGTIAHWFDWPLVFKLAESNPLMVVRLIGPVHLPPPKPLLNNMELLPACDHASAIRAMQEFTIGLIPFKQTDLTASVDPIKYYEYHALGLAIISTSFGEMALRDGQKGVFLINEHSNFASIIESASVYAYQLEEIEQFRTLNSWERRFDASGIL